MTGEFHNGSYEFEDFTLDLSRRLLMKAGSPLPLTPKVYETLLALVRNSGRVLTKDDLLKQVWGETIVEEGGLARNVSILRKTLGERPDGHRYVVTVPGQGYQFVAQVRERSDSRPPVTEDSTVASSPLSAAREKMTQASRPHHWLVATVLAGIVLAGVYALAFRKGGDGPPPAIRSIVVLPLVDLSSDPAGEYWADGMTDALIESLSSIKALRVVSRTSAMSFKGSRKALPEIARDLNADAVIEGSVQRDNGRVRIVARLIHAATDTPLWTGRYDRDLKDILSLQSDVARAVVGEINVHVTAQERVRLASVRAVHPEAYGAYLAGRYHRWKFIEEDREVAIDHFERAIRIDPTYAPAFAGLAHTWWARGVVGPLSLKEVQASARAAAAKALELDDKLAEAYAAQAYITGIFDWNWKTSDALIALAIDLDPNNVDAYYIHAMLLMAQARLDEALAQIEKAAQLDPLSAQVHSSYGRILYRAHRYDEAVSRLKRAIELEPRNSGAHIRLVEVYEAMGKYDKALALCEELTANSGRKLSTQSPISLARIYARTGKHDAARRILAKTKSADAGPLASAYAALGDKDEAFRLLFKSVQERVDWYIFIKADPPFDVLHSDPRWKELLRLMNLPAD